jgi:hypothetical protein
MAPVQAKGPPADLIAPEAAPKRSAPFDVVGGVKEAVGGAWEQLKADALKTQPDLAAKPAGFWDQMKASWDRHMAMGKTAVDAFNLALAPIAGAQTALVSRPLGTVIGKIPTATGPIGEEKAETAIDEAMMAMRPKGGLKPSAVAGTEAAPAIKPNVSRETMDSDRAVSEVSRLRKEASATDDALYAVQSNNKADIVESLNRVKALPEELKNPALAERMYLHREEGEAAPLTPEEKALYDKHVVPMLEKQNALYQDAKRRGIAPADITDDPNYVHQIVKEKGHAFDATLENQGALGHDPRYAGGRQLSSRTTPEQSIVALVDKNGKRTIVPADSKGYKIDSDVGGVIPAGRLRVGQTVLDAKGDPLTVGRSYTREKEAAMPGLQYHKNIIANTQENILRLQRAIRQDEAVQSLKSDLVGKGMAAKLEGNSEIPKDWKATTLPQFDGWRLEPRIAHVLDDFHKEGLLSGVTPEVIAKVNRVLTQAIFLNPVSAEMGHGMNVAVQWFTSRGWQNFRPGTYQRSAYNGMRALRAVNTLNDDYVKFLRNSSALRYSSTALAHNYEMMLEALHEDIVKHVPTWKTIATEVGVKTPLYLWRKLSDVSNKGLWATQDTLMMQHVYDLMDKGMTMPAAIKEAERVIPNYRVPSEIGADVLRGKAGAKVARALAQASKERAILLFQPWHYSLLRSMGTILKGSVKGNKDDLGKLFSLAVLTLGVYKLGDYGVQQVFGKDAYLRRAGLASIPYKAWQVLTHQTGAGDLVSSFVEASPALTAGAALWKNFSNNIPEHPGRAAVEAADTAANALSPIAQADAVSSGRQSIGQVIEQMFGIQQHTDRQKRGQRVGEKERESTSKYLWQGSKHFPKDDPILRGARAAGRVLKRTFKSAGETPPEDLR